MLIKPGSSLDSLLFIKNLKNFMFTLGQSVDTYFKFFMLSIDVPYSILFSKSLVVSLKNCNPQ